MNNSEVVLYFYTQPNVPRAIKKFILIKEKAFSYPSGELYSHTQAGVNWQPAETKHL